jgi:hypothetical protein
MFDFGPYDWPSPPLRFWAAAIASVFWLVIFGYALT